MVCLVRSETAPHIVDRIELNAHNRSQACLKRLVAKLLDGSPFGASDLVVDVVLADRLAHEQLIDFFEGFGVVNHPRPTVLPDGDRRVFAVADEKLLKNPLPVGEGQG